MDVIGPYRLDALLGRGTAGAVWRATRQGAVTQTVAIKRARTSRRSEVVDRLRQEAAILADLDHPHIVRVFDVLPDHSDVAIVMSYARGGSLHDLLAERGRLSPGETVAVLARVADALGSAHRRGVLHGDVKPANILFTTDGEPLLGDFGVAQHLTPEAAGLDGVAGLRAVEGTTGYVDPELVATGRPEARNDLYGLAVVAYVCLTGRQPHDGPDARAVLAAADAGEHAPLHADPSIPPPLADVVEAALSRDPALRPESAGAMARAMRAGVDPAAVVLPGTATTRVEPEPSIVGDAPTDPGATVAEPGPGEGEPDEPDERGVGGDGPASASGGVLVDDPWGGVEVPDDLSGLDDWDAGTAAPVAPEGPAPATSPRPPGPGADVPPGGPVDTPPARAPDGVAPAAEGPSAGSSPFLQPAAPRAAGSAAPAPPSAPSSAPPPDRGTRAFGPRPPPPPRGGGGGHPLVTGLVVALLLAGAVGAGLWLRNRLDAEQQPSEVAVDVRDQPGGEACPVLPELDVPPGAEAMEADLRGDGCPVPVVWDGRVLQLHLEADDERPRRYAFESEAGGAGNLVFGDWDCDGTDSPAFYQPSTGRLSYFAYIPERPEAQVESVRVDDTGIIDGHPEVVEGGGTDGCDVVEVSRSA